MGIYAQIYINFPFQTLQYLGISWEYVSKLERCDKMPPKEGNEHEVTFDIKKDASGLAKFKCMQLFALVRKI